jgi:hypothetical protein
MQIVKYMFVLFGACIGCDAGGLIVVKHDAGVDASEDAMAPNVDASTCNCNAGTSAACFDPTKDCPPANECCYFTCVMGPNETKVCGAIPVK